MKNDKRPKRSKDTRSAREIKNALERTPDNDLLDSARGVEVPLPSTWPKETDAIFDRRYIADPVERRREILKRYRVERGAWEAT